VKRPRPGSTPGQSFSTSALHAARTSLAGDRSAANAAAADITRVEITNSTIVIERYFGQGIDLITLEGSLRGTVEV